MERYSVMIKSLRVLVLCIIALMPQLGRADTLKTIQTLHETSNLRNFDWSSNTDTLAADTAGNLYGATPISITNNQGIVFKLASDGTYTVLHQFAPDGPSYYDKIFYGASVTPDNHGAVYGVQYGNSYQLYTVYGAIFKISADGTYTTLHSFTNSGYPLGASEGAIPVGSLVLGPDGNFYGMTAAGGTKNCGTIFKLTPDGSLTTLYSFLGTNGRSPAASLMIDSLGNLYGTTEFGGTSNKGTVFKLTADGIFTSLHSFNGADGAIPRGDLCRDTDGTLYGTTDGGDGAVEWGVVFKISTDGSFTLLCLGPVGTTYKRGLVLGSNGYLYGAYHFLGGFQVSTDGRSFEELVDFPQPLNVTMGNVLTDDASNLYGIALTGTGDKIYKATITGAFTDFAPRTGLIGDSITLRGLHLSSATNVKFNGVDAAFHIDSDTQITATVPIGTTIGPITIVTPAGTMGGPYRHDGYVDRPNIVHVPFDVILPPVVTTLSPGFGAVGQLVKITGAHFTGTTSVTFNGGAAASFTVDSDTLITTHVPAGATTGKVTVVNAAGTATSVSDFIVALLPTITSFTPAFGPAGTSVVITGTNFALPVTVQFGGATATFTVNSPTQITAIVPSGAESGKILVTTLGGQAFSPDKFYLPPTVHYVDAYTSSGTSKAFINGTHFVDVSSVKFNGIDATFTVLSKTSLEAIVPSSATVGKITVTTPGGTVASSQDFAPGLQITDFSPKKGDVGTLVTLTGSGFTGATAVKLGDKSAVFTIDSDTQITATVPADVDTGYFYVSSGTNTRRTDTVFCVPPSITSLVNHANGNFLHVLITGHNFRQTTSVTLDLVNPVTHGIDFRLPLLFWVVSPTLIEVNLNTGSFSDDEFLTVTTAGGTATTSVPIHYAVINTVSPNAGAVGDLVTLTGVGFTGATSVKFGDVSAAFTVVSNGLITATVPADAQSAFITVIAPFGTLRSPDVFLLPPTLTGITPTTGPANTLVTITGTNFRHTTGVSFNGVPAYFWIDSNTQITALAPLGATEGSVTVTTSAGSALSVGVFIPTL